MATATITPDQETVLAEIFIAAPPERVFQAISDPEQLSRWWGENGLYRITERAADVRPGGKWWCAGVGADGTKFSVEGEYLEVDPPRRLVHTWIASYQGPLKTVVYWDLEPQDPAWSASQWPEEGRHWHDGQTPSRGFRRRAAVRNRARRRLEALLGLMEAYVERGNIDAVRVRIRVIVRTRSSSRSPAFSERPKDRFRPKLIVARCGRSLFQITLTRQAGLRGDPSRLNSGCARDDAFQKRVRRRRSGVWSGILVKTLNITSFC